MQTLEIPFLGDTVSGECRLVYDHSTDKGYSCVTGSWEVGKLPLYVDPTCDSDAGEQSTVTCHETLGQNLFEQFNKEVDTSDEQKVEDVLLFQYVSLCRQEVSFNRC